MLTEKEIDLNSFVDVKIPRGSAIIFRDTLMHCGSAYLLSNLRQHFHCNAVTLRRRQAVPAPGNLFSYAKSIKFTR